MSDLLFLLDTAITRGELQIPRYADLFADHEKEETEQPTKEQVYAKFNKLRREKGVNPNECI